MSDRQYELYVEKKHARAEGCAEGAKEKAREIAKGLRDDGVALEIIAR